MDEISVKVKAAAAALLAGAAGVIFAPLLIKAAILAVFLLLLAVVAAARAHDMSVFEAACLYGGKVLVAVGKALAVLLVEWPTRAIHRLVVRYDLALRVQVAVLRLTSLTCDQAARLAAWTREDRTPTPALRLASPPPVEQVDDTAPAPPWERRSS